MNTKSMGEIVLKFYQEAIRKTIRRDYMSRERRFRCTHGPDVQIGNDLYPWQVL